MKGVVLKDKRNLGVEDLDDPISQNGSVILSVKRAGICGSDIHYWEDGRPKGLILGHEYSGVIIDPGARSDLKEGDRVTALPLSPCGICQACRTGNLQYCLQTWDYATGLSLTNPGALASKLSVRADMVIKVPDEVSDEEAAMTEPMAVALHAIHLANIKVGEKVLIIGGGVIGLACAMFAKKEGASFVGLSEINSARGQKAIELLDDDKWYDAKDEKFIDKVRADTIDGYDLVIDCSGNDAAVTSALISTRPGGTVILVGVSTNPITLPTVVAVMHELKVKGAIAYTKEEFQTCIDLMAKKQIDVLKFLSKTVGLSEVQASYEELTSGKSAAIKILVDPNK